MMFRLAHRKRHLLFSSRASRKSTSSRPKQMIPTTDIQKTNSRISVSCRTRGYASSLFATLQQTSSRLPQGSSKKMA
jgi:hypothetical protein